MSDERVPEDGDHLLSTEERFRRAMGEAERALQEESSRQDERFEEKRKELERKAEGIRAPEAPDVETEFGERLKAIEELAEKAKAARERAASERKKRVRVEGEDYRGLGVGLTIAYTIIGVPLGGAALGWLLDQAFGTAYWIQICTLVGAVAGVAISLMILNRSGSGS